MMVRYNAAMLMLGSFRRRCTHAAAGTADPEPVPDDV